MKYLLPLFLLLWPLLPQAQDADTTYVQFIKLADEEYRKDELSLKALDFYIKAINKADIANLSKETYQPVMRACERSGTILYAFDDLENALALFRLAYSFARAIPDQDAALVLIPKLAMTYKDMRAANLNPPLVDAEKYETAEVYYRIIKAPVLNSDGTLLVTINAGVADGIYNASTGKVLGVYNKSLKGRENVILGKAEVKNLDTNETTLIITPYYEQEGFYEIVQGDMAMMLSRIPVRDFKSIFWHLATMQIIFHNINDEPIYDYRQLLFDDSPELEANILKIMQGDIYDTWEWLNGLVDKEAQKAVFEDTMTTGRYKGSTVFDVLGRTKADDIRSFLGFVKVFPGKYMGSTWKINETYATWLLNNSPIGFEEFFGYFMDAQTKEDYQILVGKFHEEITENQFFVRINMTAEERCNAGNYDEALFICNKNLILSSLLEDPSYTGWVNFTLGRVYDIQEKNDSTLFYYRKAISFFEQSGDTLGKSLCNNNIGSIYQQEQKYTESLNYYRKSLEEKLSLINTPDFDRAIDYLRIAKAVSGIGIAHYHLADYDSALVAYTNALFWCDSAESLDAKNYAATLFTEMAKVYKKRGQFNEALSIYEKQLRQYRELAYDNKVADVYDNIADINFSLGNHRKAYDFYAAAYQIKLKLNDWDDAGFSMSNCGQAMWNIGNLDSAIICHNIALELRTKGDNKRGQAYSLGKMAELYKNLGQPEKAETFFQQAVNLYRESGDSVRLASIANDVGDFYVSMKNYSAAAEFFTHAERIYGARSMKSDLADVYSNQGDLYLKLKNYTLSSDFYRKALMLRREINERQNIMYSLVDLSHLMLYGSFKTDTALVLLNEALILADSTGSTDYQAYCFRSIGNAYSFNGQTDKAEDYYKKAFDVYVSNDDVSGQCVILRYQGQNEISRGEFAKAHKLYMQAINLARSKNLTLDMAETFNNLTEYYYYTGEFKKAFEVIDSAYRIFNENNNQYGIANTHIVDGNTHNQIGNASESMMHYKTSDSIYMALEDPLSSSTALNNMGTIAFMQGDYDNALRLFDRCLSILDSVGLKLSLEITVTCNLGEVYMEKGIWEEAERYFKISLALAENMGATRKVWDNRTMLGKLKYKQGKYQESVNIVKDSYEAYLKSDEKMAIGECATILGKNYIELKEYAKAREYLKAALNTYKGIGSRKMLWEPLYFLALAEQAENKTTEAVAYLKEAVNNIEDLSSDIVGDNSQKKLFAKANNKKDIYQSLITLLVLDGQVKEAWVYQEKLNVYGLEEQTRGEPVRGASLADAGEFELTELELKKDGIYNQLMLEKSKPQGERSAEKIAELEKMMTVAGDDYQNFLTDLLETGDMDNVIKNTVNPEELDQKRYDMDEDIVVLQYLVTGDKLIVFIAASDTLGAKVIEVSQSNIENYVNGYYNLLVSKAPIERVNAAAEQLYNVLIEPIKPFLNNKKKIAFVPGGVLVKLPFQSLGKKQNNTFGYLGSLYQIFYINDMSNTVVEESLLINSATFLAFGNADNSLPYAEKEVQAISKMFSNPSIYIQTSAQEDIAKNTMNNYQIVHFATHGNLDPIKFNNSYLTLAPNLALNEDGMLTMSELNRIKSLRTCQLIVLSACNTAVNDDKLEGWINNPAKAFLRKGAKTTLASLWAVDDLATGELMNHFYKNLFAGQTKIEAISNAQKQLMSSDNFSHPYYWAAFELIGQWK